MQNSKSAAKRVRQTKKITKRNKARKSSLWTFEKAFHAKISEKDFTGAEDYLNKTISAYDKAAKVGLVHANRVARKKSRLWKELRQAQATK